MNFEKVKKVKRSKAFTALDAVIALSIVVVIVVLFVVLYRRPAITVTITAGNQKYSYSLNVDRTVELDHLTVHIKSGKVWVTDADCHDKICERTGAISRSGQTIVCLPHGIVVSIGGGQSDLQWEIGK
ncbi:MAG: NusG domain II-containing protein [Clostridiales bacterium]|nr:NusG domain II-containing protein [Clostridiales bacterium]